MLTTEEIIKAWGYLCENNKCGSCILASRCNSRGKIEHSEEIVEILEEWWKENKPITNAEWVKKQLENIGFKVDMGFLKSLCPIPMSNIFTYNTKRDCAGKCTECKQWWDEEHKES